MNVYTHVNVVYLSFEYNWLKQIKTYLDLNVTKTGETFGTQSVVGSMMHDYWKMYVCIGGRVMPVGLYAKLVDFLVCTWVT